MILHLRKEVATKSPTHRDHRVGRIEPGSMDLVHELLGIASLLRQPVVVLLDPVLEMPSPAESSQNEVSKGRLSVERAGEFGALNDTVGGFGCVVWNP